MKDAFIYEALRTPRGKAKASGALAQIPPHEMVRQLVKAMPDEALQTDALLLGCVTQSGAQGGGIAMVAKLHSGLAESTSVCTLNNYCASGLTAIGIAAAKIQSGQAKSALAGGVEMMSQTPFLGDNAAYYTDVTTLAPANRFLPVVLTADRLAAREGITRADLDACALVSQTASAIAENDPELQASRITVRGLDGSEALGGEECIRTKTTEASLAEMKPAFGALAEQYAQNIGGETFPAAHTIAHAPPICDGAGLALIGPEAANLGEARARIVGFVEVGADHTASLTAGLAAMDEVLVRAGLTLEDMDRIEFMESFGVTIAKLKRDYPVDPARLNVTGGHLAKGHPMGASGAILTSTLLDSLDAARGRYGLVVVSGATGVGAAMIVERIERSPN